MSTKLTAVIILLFCGILIALADAFIKKSALSGNFATALKSPWLYLSILCYLVQILLVVYIFLFKFNLGILANIFGVFYSLATVYLGYAMFAETLMPIQIVGIVLGLIGVILMTK